MNTQEMISAAVSLEKYPLSQLISCFESEELVSIQKQADLLNQVKEKSHSQNKKGQKNNHAMIIGLTGMPGAGKSSLISNVCLDLLAKEKEIKIGVLAVDPSSHISGGALLGGQSENEVSCERKSYFFSFAINRSYTGRAGTMYFLGCSSYERNI